MSPDRPVGPLEAARREAGLSVDQLWVRYFGNGGTATRDDFASFLANQAWPGVLQYDITVSALNDCFTDMDRNHPVPYST